MSSIFNNIDPIYVFRRDGNENNPYRDYIETLTVANNRVILSEIPEEFHKVTVKDLNDNFLYETTSQNPDVNQYYVDYNLGIVYLNQAREGEKLTFIYKGTGYVSLSSKRIYIEHNGEEPTKTLQDLVDESSQALEEDRQAIQDKLAEADAKIAETETARQNAINATNNATAQANFALAQGQYAQQVGDENKTRWLTAVNTYADIATTYPNPQLGDTVQTIDDSKIYRWNGTQWVWTQQYNANAITDVQNKIGILSRDLEDVASRVGGGTGGALEAQSIKLGTHLFEHYQIPGEDTELVTVERDGEDYTILEIVAPTREVNGNAEATLTLMRRNDPETGAPEFMDLYNINYPDGKQMGIRIQTRGAGTLRDFVIDFNQGTGIQEAMRVKPNKDIIYRGNARYRSADDQIIEFQDINGNRAAYFGRIVSTPRKRVLLVNSVGGNSVELHDNGSTVFYSPTGDFYVYLDSGSMFVNDNRVQTQGYTTLKSPDGSIWKAEIDNSGTVTWVKQG